MSGAIGIIFLSMLSPCEIFIQFCIAAPVPNRNVLSDKSLALYYHLTFGGLWKAVRANISQENFVSWHWHLAFGIGSDPRKERP
jgi:hypothetical protein